MVNQEIDEIRQRRKEWTYAVNRGDLGSYVSLIDKDAVWISQNLAPVVSRQAIKEWMQPFFKQFYYEFITSDHEIQCSEGWACEQAHFSSKIVPKNGDDPISHKGQYVLIWRKSSKGLWMMNRYIVVADLESNIEERNG